MYERECEMPLESFQVIVSVTDTWSVRVVLSELVVFAIVRVQAYRPIYCDASDVTGVQVEEAPSAFRSVQFSSRMFSISLCRICVARELSRAFSITAMFIRKAAKADANTPERITSPTRSSTIEFPARGCRDVEKNRFLAGARLVFVSFSTMPRS